MSGIPLPDNSPTIKLGGNLFTLGTSALGMMGQVTGIYENLSAGWTNVSAFQITSNPGDMVQWVQAAGGVRKYLDGFAAEANAWMASQGHKATFTSSIHPVAEPTTDDQVIAAINAFVVGGAWHGAEIPQALLDAYAAYFGAAPVGTVVAVAPGTLSAVMPTLTFYTEPSGLCVALRPDSDINAIAKACSGLAARWKAAYDFTPS